MKMTKRILSLLLCIAMLFGLTACKKNNEPSSDYEYVTSEYFVEVDGEEEETDESTDKDESKDQRNGYFYPFHIFSFFTKLYLPSLYRQ